MRRESLEHDHALLRDVLCFTVWKLRKLEKASRGNDLYNEKRGKPFKSNYAKR